MWATVSSDHSRLATVIASSRRGPLVAKSTPAASHSPEYHPAPTPQTARPPDTMSRVAKARAETKGCLSANRVHRRTEPDAGGEPRQPAQVGGRVEERGVRLMPGVEVPG
ncbi:hypothetical protein GCM10020219_068750 [Nonomuraea dietziae]